MKDLDSLAEAVASFLEHPSIVRLVMHPRIRAAVARVTCVAVELRPLPDVAAELTLKEGTLRRWVERHDSLVAASAARKEAGRWVLSADGVRAWLEQHRPQQARQRRTPRRRTESGGDSLPGEMTQ